MIIYGRSVSNKAFTHLFYGAKMFAKVMVEMLNKLSFSNGKNKINGEIYYFDKTFNVFSNKIKSKKLITVILISIQIMKKRFVENYQLKINIQLTLHLMKYRQMITTFILLLLLKILSLPDVNMDALKLLREMEKSGRTRFKLGCKKTHFYF